MKSLKVNQKMTTVIAAAMILNFFIASFAFCQITPSALTQISKTIKNPAELSNLLATEFRYETEMPDRWSKAEETAVAKKGDCEDFAILAQEILKRINIDSQILIIKYKGISQAHAICIFKEGDTYSFISNQELVRTNAPTVTAAVEEQYTDWESIKITDAKNRQLQFISRNNTLANTSITNVASY